MPTQFFHQEVEDISRRFCTPLWASWDKSNTERSHVLPYCAGITSQVESHVYIYIAGMREPRSSIVPHLAVPNPNFDYPHPMFLDTKVADDRMKKKCVSRV